MFTSDWAKTRGERIATIAAVRIGQVREHDWGPRPVLSAAVKHPVGGRIRLGVVGFDGDEQADTKNHGGPEKAALLYCGDHYPRWRSEEGIDLPDGALFENVTLSGGPDESTIVLGEVWRLGTAVVQVSQPRSPCFKLAKQWQIEDLVLRVQRTGWSGWYVRVLDEGTVGAGDAVERLLVPASSPTMAEISRVMNVNKDDLPAAERLLEAPGLPERWRVKLRARLAGRPDDDSARLRGPA